MLAQHGNKPSRGAKIDEQIMLEVSSCLLTATTGPLTPAQEQAELERKGKA